MATKKDIISLPKPQLRQKSKRIGIITDEVKKTIADMAEATLDWEESRDHEVGVALAAVQIGRLERIVIIRSNPDDKKSTDFQVMINPEITKKEGQPEEDFEGCLSIKDIYGKVPRYPKIKVKALDINGREFRVTAEGFLARVLQHEIDHTKGIVFIDHIKDKPEAFYRLATDGKLTPLDYDKDVKENTILWK